MHNLPHTSEKVRTIGLTFMLAGSVTSIPAAIAIYSLAKARLVTLYLIIAAVGSMASGYLFLLYLA